MKLIVGLLFNDTSPEELEWLKIQLHFLKETTTDYHHGVWINHGGQGEFREHTKIFGMGSGLKGLLEYLQSLKDYRYFLILNHAFPIREDWQKYLEGRLNSQNKKKIATLLRCENSETTWHPDVLFTGSEGLAQITIDENGVQTNQDHVWPLIRSNKVNVHPVNFGIYHDLFFCLGNEPQSEYHAHYAPAAKVYHRRLMTRPLALVRTLAGWNPDKYPKGKVNE